MLYNRNKNAFKKTTSKVEHPTATQSLLALIRQTQQNNKKNDQNKTQNLHGQEPITPKNVEKPSIMVLPKVCQSFENSPQKTKPDLTYYNAYSMVIRTTNEQNRNQIKLLRHQINRLFNDNQYLLQKVKEKEERRQEQTQNDKISQYEEKIHSIEKKLKQAKDQSYKLKVEKECLMDFLEEEKNTNQTAIEEYQNQIKKLTQDQIQLTRFKKQNQNLRSQILSLTSQIRECKEQVKKVMEQFEPSFQDHNITTTEQLCRVLQPYPKYYKLFTLIICQYEEKVIKLQDQICKQKSGRERLMEWCNQTYNMISSINEDPQLTEHMENLYQIDYGIEKSKIGKLLKQVRALSIGIDEKQVQEMEQELEEYIVSLKGRNQVIKEAEYEDGSSILSDAFTQNDIQ